MYNNPMNKDKKTIIFVALILLIVFDSILFSNIRINSCREKPGSIGSKISKVIIPGYLINPRRGQKSGERLSGLDQFFRKRSVPPHLGPNDGRG